MGQAKSRKGARFRSQAEDSKRVVRSLTAAKDVQIRTNLPQARKISNGLSIMLHSEVPDGAPLEVYQTVLFCIVLAWNLSLLPAEKRSAALEQSVPSMADLDDIRRCAFMQQIERLIAKKSEMFPHDKRYILTWDVQITAGRCRVTAGGLDL